jgi:hypothetical protein
LRALSFGFGPTISAGVLSASAESAYRTAARHEKQFAVIAIAALALAGGLACAWDLALIWDGGAQFCYTLYHGIGYGYGARFFTEILWQPVVWAASWTKDLAVLRFLYGLPFCLAPAIAAALSWWMVARTRPELFPWALLGICAASLPVEVFAINESIFQLNMFWPLFLGLLVPLNRARWMALGILAIFQFSHPQGLLLLSGAAVVLWLQRTEPRLRPRAWIVSSAALICFGRVLLFPDVEAAQQANAQVVFALFRQSVLGWPLVGWMCILAAVFTRSTRLAMLFLALAAAAWGWWAVDPWRWSKALDARRFVVLFAAPFFLGAWGSLPKWDGFSIRRRSIADYKAAPQSLSNLMPRASAVALIFAGTLLLQAHGWSGLMDRVLAQVEADPRSVVPTEDFAWLQGSPADHWGLGSQVIAKLGGRKLVLDAAGRAALDRHPPLVKLGYDAWVTPEPGILGWFDFREAIGQ